MHVAASHRFVTFGFPRSGTTLLRRLLDAHPLISCPPETYLFASCGKFLEETPTVDGLSVGVLPGLAFSDIAEDEALDRLRSLAFGLEAAIAGEKRVWVEKTAVDIFYLEQLERLLVGHCRFICVVRNPFDVLVSVKDLCDGMDQFLPELLPFVRRHGSQFDAYAEAWADRMEALTDFIGRHPESCFVYRYEDLVANPVETLDRLLRFMDLDGGGDDMLAGAFELPAKVGLGDWRMYDMAAVEQNRVERWRDGMAESTARRIAPILTPMMHRHGYVRPKFRAPAGKADAARHYTLSKQLRQSMTRPGGGEA